MIGTMSLSEISDALAVDYRGENKVIRSISTDSRSIEPGSVFVAIHGERYDGHEYIEAALKKGASMIISEKPGYCPESSCLLVKDTVEAYGLLAKLNRQRFSGTLIAITGSAGKTTTRSMLHKVLSLQGFTHSNRANDNNEIGVSRSLLELTDVHDYAIIEMGARKSGDIAWLCAIAQPDIGLIINVAEAHLETFGSLEDVARAKGELFSGLDSNAIAVANADDGFSERMLNSCQASSYFFSLENNKSQCYLSNITLLSDASYFDLNLSLPDNQVSQQCRSVKMQVAGKHNLYNASATALTAALVGCSVDTISKGLADFQAVSGRQNTIRLNENVHLVDDSYNANPASLAAAIDALTLESHGVNILVLGDMLELGSASVKLHQKAGIYAFTQGITMLFSYGRQAELTAQSFRNLSPGMAFSFDSHQALTGQLKAVLQLATGQVRVLVKGSRSMAMEEIINSLRGY